MNVTRTLAAFIKDTRFEELPSEITAKAKLAFLDWLGCTLAGSRHSSAILLRESLSECFGPPQATIIGTDRKTDVISAALLNGYASHVLDFDDVHMGWIGHPSVTLFPALAALAERQAVSGRDFITAFAAGLEVECRVGAAIPSHYLRGWHTTGTLGHFGAAAASAKLLDLQIDQIVNSLGTAGTQAAGLRQVFGTMGKPLHAGKAASNGLMAAMLAARGFTSSRDILGGAGGFCSVLSDGFDQGKVTDRLGSTWLADAIAFKRHASCYSTHALIECALTLRDRVRPMLDRVRAIRCRSAPLAAQIAHIQSPRTGLQAKFSQAFCVVLALTRGCVSEREFTDETVNDPLLQDVLARTTVQPVPSLRYPEAEIDVILDDGEPLQGRVDTQQLALPLESLQASLIEKFIGLAGEHTRDRRIEPLVKQLMELDTSKDVGSILGLLRETRDRQLLGGN